MERVNIILLRGLSREIRHWGDFPKQLEKLDGIEHVFCLEMPGAGKRYREDSPRDINDYVEDLRAHFLALDRNARWVILGVSLGAMIALRWCREYPKDFTKLIVLNTSAKNLTHPLKRFSLVAAKTALQSIFSSDIEKRERLILELTTHLDHKRDREEIIQDWVSYAKEYPFSRNNFFNQIFAAAKFICPKDITLPVLILAANNDQLADVSNSIRLNNYLESTSLYLHDSAGHDLGLDDPNWVLEKVRGFLA